MWKRSSHRRFGLLAAAIGVASCSASGARMSRSDADAAPENTQVPSATPTASGGDVPAPAASGGDVPTPGVDAAQSEPEQTATDGGPREPTADGSTSSGPIGFRDTGSDGGVIGWASVSGDGVPTTTGGVGGSTVTAASADELITLAGSSEPLIIELEGEYSVPRLQVSSNKTLIGIGPSTTIHGGIRIRGTADQAVENVIVQNIRVDGASSEADGDALQIYYAHHVWIDHCEFFDAPDGNLDIVHAANWVTVSWTKFLYTSNAPAPDHRFSNFIGHTDDNASEDTGRLKVTFHHDWWADDIVERMPRVRFGDVHIFDSYFTASGNNYAIGAAFESRVVIENNFFENVNDPHIFYDGEATAEIVARDNAYDNTTGGQQSGQGPAFSPPYDYSMEPATEVPAIVTQGAGPR